MTAITGPSGSGKSTLLRLIAGHQSPTSGRVLIDGTPVRVANWREPAERRVTSVQQDYRLVPFLTVAENIRLAVELRGFELTDGELTNALDGVALPSHYSSRLPQALSGGEQQRVAIARALACNSNILVADEPTGALDEENSVRIAELLTSLADHLNMTVLVATHDSRVAAHAHRRVRMNTGSLEDLL